LPSFNASLVRKEKEGGEIGEEYEKAPDVADVQCERQGNRAEHDDH